MSSSNKFNWSCVVLSAIILCAAIPGVSDSCVRSNYQSGPAANSLAGLSIRGGHNRRRALRLCLDGHYTSHRRRRGNPAAEKFRDHQRHHLDLRLCPWHGDEQGWALSAGYGPARYIVSFRRNFGQNVRFINVRKAIAGDSDAAMGTVRNPIQCDRGGNLGRQ